MVPNSCKLIVVEIDQSIITVSLVWQGLQIVLNHTLYDIRRVLGSDCRIKLMSSARRYEKTDLMIAFCLVTEG